MHSPSDGVKLSVKTSGPVFATTHWSVVLAGQS